MQGVGAIIEGVVVKQKLQTFKIDQVNISQFTSITPVRDSVHGPIVSLLLMECEDLARRNCCM